MRWKNMSWFTRACWIVRAVVTLPPKIVRSIFPEKPDRRWLCGIAAGFALFGVLFVGGFWHPWMHTLFFWAVVSVLCLLMLVQLLHEVFLIVVFIRVLMRSHMEEEGVRFE